MEQVLAEIFQQIKFLCPSTQHLLWFWHTKNADANDKKWDELDEQKDSYDRQDNYNVIGLACYLVLSSKSAICSLTGTPLALFARVNEYLSPIANDFMLESLVPLFNYCLRS